MNCKNKPIVIYKGFGTQWNGIDLLYVSFKTEISLDGFSAEFFIGDVVKRYNDIQDGFAINLTAQETNTLSIGQITGTLVIVDTENNKKPFSTEIPFLIKDWEDGNIELDGFSLYVNAEILKNDLVINISSGIKNIEKYTGFDSSKIQTLKNINGEITWVDDP